MKLLGMIFAMLMFVQSADAVRNSKCMIEADDSQHEALLAKGYFPINSTNATANGYHPGLRLIYAESEGVFLGTMTISDQTGLTIWKRGFVGNGTDKWVGVRADAYAGIQPCQGLTR